MRIVPGNRLLIWVLVLLPCVTVGAMMPAASTLTLFLCAGLIAFAVMDAATARSLTTITVSLPEMVRLTKNRTAGIELRIRNAGGRVLRIGLPLPSSFSSPYEFLDVQVPAGENDATVEWNCTPSVRGRYLLSRCYIETSSSRGFWSVRRPIDCKSELRVYPNLLNERKRLASLFLNRGNFGLHTQRVVGQGRDFEKLRDYIPGDSYDDIHWKATAKRGRPITKLFQVERTQEIYVAIDTSRLSARQVDGESVLDRMMTAALTLGLVAERQGDKFGLITFSDRVRQFVRAANGKHHYNACRDALYTLNSGPVAPDYQEFFSFVRIRLRRRALVFLLTDLGDPLLAENFLDHVELICRQHLLLVAMLKPPTVNPLFTSPLPESTDDIYQALGGHLTWKTLQELHRSLHNKGTDFSLIDSEHLTSTIVRHYMNIKARQAL